MNFSFFVLFFVESNEWLWSGRFYSYSSIKSKDCKYQCSISIKRKYASIEQYWQVNDIMERTQNELDENIFRTKSNLFYYKRWLMNPHKNERFPLNEMVNQMHLKKWHMQFDWKWKTQKISLNNWFHFTFNNWKCHFIWTNAIIWNCYLLAVVESNWIELKQQLNWNCSVRKKYFSN